MEKLRRTFVDRDLLYLFSYDANLEMAREELGFVPGGSRANIFSTAKDSRVYHVMQEQAVEGVKPITGVVQSGTDWVFLREDNDVGIIDVRLAILTDDGETIHVSYGGVYSGGPRGYRKLMSEKPKLGTEEEPAEARLVVTPRFEASAPQYRWLSEHQCVAFGKVNLIRSLVRQASFDVYAMDF